MIDFLFHKVSEKEKDKIRKESKALLDRFSQRISKVSGNTEELIERKESEREEGKMGEDFSREIMFDNAPKKNKDFIVSEKKEW